MDGAAALVAARALVDKRGGPEEIQASFLPQLADEAAASKLPSSAGAAASYRGIAKDSSPSWRRASTGRDASSSRAAPSSRTSTSSC